MSTNEDAGGWQVNPITGGLVWVRDPQVQIINGHTVPLRAAPVHAGPGGTLIPGPPPAAIPTVSNT